MMTSRLSGSDPTLLQRAVQALRRSDKTRAELEALLLRHGNNAETRAVLDQLVSQRLQSDARTAELRARQALTKGWAAPRALAALVHAGITQALAQQVVDEVYATHNPAQAIQQEVARLGPHPPAAARLKAARALLRRGFAQDDVARALGLEDLEGQRPPGDDA